MAIGPVNDLDLAALPNIGWEIVDPDGDFEGEEKAWVAGLRQQWPAAQPRRRAHSRPAPTDPASP